MAKPPEPKPSPTPPPIFLVGPNAGIACSVRCFSPACPSHEMVSSRRPEFLWPRRLRQAKKNTADMMPRQSTAMEMPMPALAPADSWESCESVSWSLVGDVVPFGEGGVVLRPLLLPLPAATTMRPPVVLAVDVWGVEVATTSPDICDSKEDAVYVLRITVGTPVQGSREAAVGATGEPADAVDDVPSVADGDGGDGLEGTRLEPPAESTPLTVGLDPAAAALVLSCRGTIGLPVAVFIFLPEHSPRSCPTTSSGADIMSTTPLRQSR